MPSLLALLAILVAGLATGLFLPPGLHRGPAALTVAAAAAAVLAHRQGLLFVARACGALALAAAGAWWGGLALDRAERPPLVRWLHERAGGGGWAVKADRLVDPVLLRGRLLRDAAPAAGGVQLSLQVTAVSIGGAWEAVDGGVALTVGGALSGEGHGAWRAGRVIELPATLRAPSRYLNHGVPDPARALARRGTALVGTVKSGALVEVVQHGRPWDEGAAWLRLRVRQAMARHVAPRDPTAAAIGTAIVIGDRAQMAPDLTARLQEAGTYHVVAISGGNIAVLTGALLALLWALGVRFAAAAVLAALLLAAHAWVIGGGPSVVRATLMAVIYLCLRAVDQRTAPVRAVVLGAGVMVVADPLALTDAGFWLTFGATVALLALARLWPSSAAGQWWQAPLAVSGGSVAVEVMLLPVSAFVFQRVTLAGVVANLGAVPAMAVVQVAASTCVLADLVGLVSLAGWAGAATDLAADALVGSSRVVDLAPWTTWRVPSPPAWLVATYYLLLAGWWMGRARNAGAVAPVCAGGAVVVWVWMAAAPQTLAIPTAGMRLRVTALDVGQGDALIVEFPNRRTLVVDAGGTAGGAFDIGDRVVGAALRARGWGRVDYVAVTHGDLDHIGGVPALVRDFRPMEVWMGVPVPASPLEAATVEAASRGRASVRRLRTGDHLMVGEVEVRVHHPPAPDWERQRPRNDDSLVLELRYGDVSLLLTGDVGREVEAAALAELDLRPVVILKAPHHGSAASSSAPLLARLRPRAVLVSAGRGNPFGHPAPAAIERYAATGSQVFRTDRDGQIDVETDGQLVEIRSYTGLRWRWP